MELFKGLCRTDIDQDKTLMRMLYDVLDLDRPGHTHGQPSGLSRQRVVAHKTSHSYGPPHQECASQECARACSVKK